MTVQFRNDVFLKQCTISHYKLGNFSCKREFLQVFFLFKPEDFFNDEVLSLRAEGKI